MDYRAVPWSKWYGAGTRSMEVPWFLHPQGYLSWDVPHEHVFLFYPLLDGKELNIDVPGPISWLILIRHHDGSGVIFVNRGWHVL